MCLKKLFLLFFFSTLCITVYLQENIDNEIVVSKSIKEEQNFRCLVKFKPLAMLLGVVVGGFNLELASVPYITPKIGIPVEFQMAVINRVTAVALLSGIEAVPVTHREKSGLYLNYELGGIFVVTGDFGFCTMGHIGYQLVTHDGFVVTSAIGVAYDTINKQIAPHFMLDLGFALRKGK